MGILLSANANPNVNPSAHLWQTTAKLNPTTSEIVLDNPILNPSNTAWIPIAIYNKNGAKSDFLCILYYYYYINDYLTLLITFYYVDTIFLNVFSSSY